MDRRRKLFGLTAFFTTLLFATAVFAQSYMLLPIVSVYDGDTIKTTMSRLPAPLDKVSIRINNIDTPERGWRAECEREAELAEKAKLHVEKLVEGHDKMQVKNFKWDKYGGRILGDVYVGGVNIAESLIAAGLAREYHGGAKESWCH